MIGLFSMVQLLAILFSPLLGTWITQQLGWDWIFFITFGFLIVAMLLVGLGRQASPAIRSGRWTEIDIAGGRERRRQGGDAAGKSQGERLGQGAARDAGRMGETRVWP